jgi:hypothetical protein
MLGVFSAGTAAPITQVPSPIEQAARIRFIEEVERAHLDRGGHAVDIFASPEFNMFYNAGTLIIICGKAMGPFVVDNRKSGFARSERRFSALVSWRIANVHGSKCTAVGARTAAASNVRIVVWSSRSGE